MRSSDVFLSLPSAPMSMPYYGYSYLILVATLAVATVPLCAQQAGAERGAGFQVNYANERISRQDTAFHHIADYWRDDPARGVTLAETAIAHASRNGDTTSLALGYCALGINQWALGKNVDAARSYHTAIKSGRRSGNRDVLAKAYNNLGLLNFSLGAYIDARSWFLRSMDLRRQLPDSAGLGRVYTNLGLVARRLGELDTARAYFTTAITLHLRSKDTLNLARTSHYLGEIDATLGASAPALTVYRRAEQLFFDRPDRMGYALLLVDIAKVYHEMDNEVFALRYAQHALSLGRELRAPFTIREAADILHRIYSLKGDHRAAYAMLSEASRYADTLRNESAMRAIANYELQTVLEQMRSEDRQKLERREDEIEGTLRRERLVRNVSFVVLFLAIVLAIVLWIGFRQIRRRNVIILEKSAQIESINVQLRHIDASREKLFSIIGHDLRGPVGATYSIATLMQERENDLTPIEKAQLTDAIVASSSATSDLLDNLLNWTRSQYGQLSFNPTENDVDALIENQLSLVSQIAQKKLIHINIEGQKGIKGSFDSHMISAVLRNLLMNAIKFTSDGGSIAINAVVVRDMVEVSVRDTGVGMSVERVEALRNRTSQAPLSGTRGERGTGLGLEICREFLDRHQGELTFESIEGGGSTFTARFPLRPPVAAETPASKL